MPFPFPPSLDMLNSTSLGLSQTDSDSPGGGGFTIPRKWFVAAAFGIAGCFLTMLGWLAFKALFPGLPEADKEATVTAAFATVVQENLATFRAQPTPAMPSSTPLLAATETAAPSPTATLLPSATTAPGATIESGGAPVPGLARVCISQGVGQPCQSLP
jgi:hypothetical protein